MLRFPFGEWSSLIFLYAAASRFFDSLVLSAAACKLRLSFHSPKGNLIIDSVPSTVG